MAKVEERTPYIVVAFQECERMNILTREIRRSLRELHLGLQVSKRNVARGHGCNPQGHSDRHQGPGSWRATVLKPSKCLKGVAPQKLESSPGDIWKNQYSARSLFNGSSTSGIFSKKVISGGQNHSKIELGQHTQVPEFDPQCLRSLSIIQKKKKNGLVADSERSARPPKAKSGFCWCFMGLQNHDRVCKKTTEFSTRRHLKKVPSSTKSTAVLIFFF